MDVKRRWNRNSYFYDLWAAPMEMMGGRSWRTRLFSSLPTGNILEIGIGTGVNIEYYPRSNRNYVGIDISPNMIKRAQNRAIRNDLPISLKEMDVEHMDFPSGTFDAVVSTCVFCSIRRPVQGLQEARRVLKKDGIGLFLEHMRPEGPVLGKIFDKINPLIAGMMGVSINRKTAKNIRAAGFEILEEEDLFIDIFRYIKAKPLPV